MARYGLWSIVHGTYLVLKQVLLILALSLTQIILALLIFIVEAGKIRIKCVRNPLLHVILCERKRERAQLAFTLCGETCFYFCVLYKSFQLLATPLTTSRKLVYILYATVVRGQSNESRFLVEGELQIIAQSLFFAFWGQPIACDGSCSSEGSTFPTASTFCHIIFMPATLTAASTSNIACSVGIRFYFLL